MTSVQLRFKRTTPAGFAASSKKLVGMGLATIGLFAAIPSASASPFTLCGTSPRDVCVFPLASPDIPLPPEVPGKELSTRFDRGLTGPDPEQNLAWDGIGGTAEATDYTGSRADFPDTLDREVDALANSDDALYDAAISNTAAIVISVDGNPNIYFEDIFGGTGLWADQDVSTPDGLPGSVIDDMTPILDLDGLELWGEDGPAGADANRYSLESTGATGVPDPLGISVWDFAGGVSTPLWSIADIAGIVSLASGVDLASNQVNLDAMMTSGVSSIMFSIDAAGSLDGGEIFVGTRVGGFGTAISTGAFLFHGGHLWDTAFDVRGTFGVASENINALEAIATLEPNGPEIPEPLTVLLVGMGLAVVGWRRRQTATIAR